MSYYAKVLDGKVLQIMVADATYMNSFEDETPGTWIETSKRTKGGILYDVCLLYTSPSPRDKRQSRMPSSA